jgi:hypothetical protein
MEQRSMNELNDKKLQKLTVPNVDMKSHQMHLKQALLAASRPEEKITKTRWSNLMTKPKFIVSGAAMAFAVLSIMAFSIFAIQGPVSAAELTQQSLNKVSQLSPGALHELNLKVNGDPKAELEAAKHAKDLQILTYEEWQALDDEGSIHTLQTGPTDIHNDGPSSMNTTDLKYLRYTDSSGAVHTIGVGKDGLPVIVMVFRHNKDGSSEGSIQVQAGTAGGSGSMMMVTGGSAHAEAMPAGGSTSCSATAGSQPTCTNSDGSPAPAPNCQTLANGAVTCSASATGQNTKP